jgi:hypothetical protein
VARGQADQAGAPGRPAAGRCAAPHSLQSRGNRVQYPGPRACRPAGPAPRADGGTGGLGPGGVRESIASTTWSRGCLASGARRCPLAVSSRLRARPHDRAVAACYSATPRKNLTRRPVPQDPRNDLPQRDGNVFPAETSEGLRHFIGDSIGKPCSNPAVAAVAGSCAVTTKCPYEVMSTPPVPLNLCHWLLQPARKRSYREKSVRHGTFALLADPLLQGGEGGGGVTAHARREQP